MIKDVTMDKDIREFLDRATQKRLYEEKRKRKDKRLAKQANLQERKSRRNAAQNGVDLLCGEHIKGDNKLCKLADNGRDYNTDTKFRTKYRTPEEQKKYDWENSLVLFLYQWEDKTKNVDFVLRQRIMGAIVIIPKLMM